MARRLRARAGRHGRASRIERGLVRIITVTRLEEGGGSVFTTAGWRPA
jgi:hypothetical protein